MLDKIFDFNGMLGQLEEGACRYAANGSIAVKTADGYKTYDTTTKNFVNCDEFCVELGEDLFYVIPVNSVSVGDIIVSNYKLVCVIEAAASELKVVDYCSGEVKTVLPEKNILLGNVCFYGKVVSPFIGMFKNGNGVNGMQNFFKYKMMMDILGKKNGKMSKLMLISMLSGNNGLDFGGMFNGSNDNGMQNILKFKFMIDALNDGNTDGSDGLSKLMMLSTISGNSGFNFGEMFGGIFGGQTKTVEQ